MKRLIIFLLALGLLGGGFFYSRTGQQNSVEGNIPAVTKQRADVTPDTAAPPIEGKLPKLLVIPKLGVSAPVEYVGEDAKGNMDVPKADMNVAWYQPGFKPGSMGNAVMAGHLDTRTGAPAVFYKLATLHPGDPILINATDGTELTFIVVKVTTYPAGTFPLVDVFGPTGKVRLNLITCEGVYKASQGYSHRTVVYSELQE
jgi:sortase A